MKFKDLEELKSFLLWAKSKQIEAVEVDGISVRFSQLAFVPDLNPFQAAQEQVDQEAAELTAQNYKPSSKTWVEPSEDSAAEDEDLLFWSANGN